MITKIGLKKNALWLLDELKGNWESAVMNKNDIYYSATVTLNHIQLMDLRDILQKHNVDVEKSISTCNPDMHNGINLSIYIIKNENMQ